MNVVVRQAIPHITEIGTVPLPILQRGTGPTLHTTGGTDPVPCLGPHIGATVGVGPTLVTRGPLRTIGGTDPVPVLGLHIGATAHPLSESGIGLTLVTRGPTLLYVQFLPATAGAITVLFPAVYPQEGVGRVFLREQGATHPVCRLLQRVQGVAHRVFHLRQGGDLGGVTLAAIPQQ